MFTLNLGNNPAYFFFLFSSLLFSFVLFCSLNCLMFNMDSLTSFCTSCWTDSKSSLLLLQYPCSFGEDDTVDMSSLSFLSKTVGTCTILSSSTLGVTQQDLMEGFLVGVLLVLLDFDDLEPESSFLELFLVVGVLVFIILSGGKFCYRCCWWC